MCEKEDLVANNVWVWWGEVRVGFSRSYISKRWFITFTLWHYAIQVNKYFSIEYFVKPVLAVGFGGFQHRFFSSLRKDTYNCITDLCVYFFKFKLCGEIYKYSHSISRSQKIWSLGIFTWYRLRANKWQYLKKY